MSHGRNGATGSGPSPLWETRVGYWVRSRMADELVPLPYQWRSGTVGYSRCARCHTRIEGAPKDYPHGVPTCIGCHEHVESVIEATRATRYLGYMQGRGAS